MADAPVYQVPQVATPTLPAAPPMPQAPTVTAPTIAPVTIPMPQVDPAVMELWKAAIAAQQNQPQTAAPTADPNIMALFNAVMAKKTPTDPTLERLKLYQQLNAANPGKGPCTNLVNPIVNALLVRQAGSALQAAAESKDQEERLKAAIAMGKYQSGVTQAGLNAAKIDELRAKIAALPSGLMGQYQALVKAGVFPNMGDITRTNIAQGNINKDIGTATARNQTQAATANAANTTGLMRQDMSDKTSITRTGLSQEEANARTNATLQAQQDRLEQTIKDKNARLRTSLDAKRSNLVYQEGIKQDIADAKLDLAKTKAANQFAKWGYDAAMAGANLQISVQNMKTRMDALQLDKIRTQDDMQRTMMSMNAEERTALGQQMKAIDDHAATMTPEASQAFIRATYGPFFTRLTGSDFKDVDPKTIWQTVYNYTMPSLTGVEPWRTVTTVTPASQTAGQAPYKQPPWPWEGGQKLPVPPSSSVPNIPIPTPPAYGTSAIGAPGATPPLTLPQVSTVTPPAATPTPGATPTPAADLPPSPLATQGGAYTQSLIQRFQQEQQGQ